MLSFRAQELQIGQDRCGFSHRAQFPGFTGSRHCPGGLISCTYKPGYKHCQQAYHSQTGETWNPLGTNNWNQLDTEHQVTTASPCPWAVDARVRFHTSLQIWQPLPVPSIYYDYCHDLSYTWWCGRQSPSSRNLWTSTIPRYDTTYATRRYCVSSCSSFRNRIVSTTSTNDWSLVGQQPWSPLVNFLAARFLHRTKCEAWTTVESWSVAVLVHRQFVQKRVSHCQTVQNGSWSLMVNQHNVRFLSPNISCSIYQFELDISFLISWVCSQTRRPPTTFPNVLGVI